MSVFYIYISAIFLSKICIKNHVSETKLKKKLWLANTFVNKYSCSGLTQFMEGTKENDVTMFQSTLSGNNSFLSSSTPKELSDNSFSAYKNRNDKS